MIFKKIKDNNSKYIVVTRAGIVGSLAVIIWFAEVWYDVWVSHEHKTIQVSGLSCESDYEEEWMLEWI